MSRRGTASVAALGGWLRVDSLALVFLVATTFLYCLTAVFAVGYAAADRSGGAVYRRRLFAGLNLFAWSMAVAPLVNNLGLLWVAIEVTTVLSALLVAMEGTDGAIEAAWKYILIASLGLGLSLLATAVMYRAGSPVLGSTYDLSYSKLLGAASRFPASTVRLSYLLAVLGFGTKVGLFPVHTWLPDAHSEAPTPVSALLSGSLLATSFYAILRFYQLSERSAGAAFSRDVLGGFGVATLMLGAVYLASQRDLKRLLAYSSIEHMGILAIGVSFASPLAVAGRSCTSWPMPPRKGHPFSERAASPASSAPRTWSESRAVPGSSPGPAPAYRRDAGPFGNAPLRHVPLRAFDRGRRTGRRYGGRHGRASRRCCTGCAGHSGLFGAVLAHDTEHACPGLGLRYRRRAADAQGRDQQVDGRGHGAGAGGAGGPRRPPTGAAGQPAPRCRR